MYSTTNARLTKEDQEDLQEQAQGDNQYHKVEKAYERQFDATAKNLANQYGYREVPWLGLTYVMLLMQVALAIMTQIHRKDQVTITVCALGFYMIEYAEHCRRW